MQYMFNVSKIDEVFEFLVREKFITFHHIIEFHHIKNRKDKNIVNTTIHITIPIKHDGLLRTFCMRGLIVLKFLEKKRFMAVDDDPFPPAASINVAVTNLRVFLNDNIG